ncbi:MAG: AMP-binding protein [Pseudomonadota bacterium]
MNFKKSRPLLFCDASASDPCRGLDRVVLWRDGEPIKSRRLLAQAEGLARRLPGSTHVINCCEERQNFVVALLAAMLCKQITLLPNDRTERSIELLHQTYRSLYVASDSDVAFGGIESIRLDLATADDTEETVKIPDLPEELPAVIAFTSGTTGQPQANPKAFGLLAKTAELIADRFSFWGPLSPNLVATVPPQHMYGLETTIALTLWGPAAVDCRRPFFPADVADCLTSLPEPRVLITTPVHLRAILGSKAALPKLEMIISATAPLSTDLAQQAETRYETQVMEIFGFSEAGTIATRRTLAGSAWTMCDELELREEGDSTLVDAEHFAKPLKFNDKIEVISPTCFRHLGREADSINVAGKRASLAGLNSILSEIPGVEDGVFHPISQDDEKQTIRLAAFIVAPQAQRDSINAALKARIDSAFWPRQTFFIKSLPRSETGKLSHSALSVLLKNQQPKNQHD